VIEYRAYIVGVDGHFVSFRAFACDNDADGHDVELWNGPRFVIKLEADPNKAASVASVSNIGQRFFDRRATLAHVRRRYYT
jgi:hypothetical protein